MNQMMNLMRFANCDADGADDASDEKEEPSWSESTTIRLASNMEDE